MIEVLPNTMFRVGLPNGHRILARIPGRARPRVSGVLPGDRVVVEMSPYDLSQGCITQRQK